MLEICPSIADGKPSLQVHPLGIGGKADPARLVFNTPAGPALNASLIDLGNRFRLLVNEVDVVKPDQPMPKLPVAQARLEVPGRISRTPAPAGFTPAARITPASARPSPPKCSKTSRPSPDLEAVVIDADTKLRQFKQELLWNDCAYGLKSGWI